jgi:Flp pilus assembly protein TadD
LFFCFLLFLFAPPDSKDATALLQKGLLSLQSGNLTEARDNLQAASRLDPQNPYPWTSLAEVYLRLKQRAQADEAARRAEKAGQGNAVVAHALAMYYAKTGQYAHAGTLEAQFAASPRADAGAGSRAAGLYLNGGDAAHALPLARKAVADQPSADNEDLLGRSLIAAGQSSEGLQHLASASHSAPNNPQIAYDYAQGLLNTQDFTQAAAVLESAAKANPADAQLPLALGVARYGQRRFADAITAFLQAIQLAPSVPQPYLFLGRMLDQAGDQLPTITADYRKWLQAEPKRPEPPLLLAKALIAANAESEEPEPLLRRSVQLDPKNWEAHYELGQLLEKKHKYPEAAAELERAVQLEPKQAMPHYHLARVYDRLGKREQAQAERETHQRLNAADGNHGGGMANP